MDDHQQPQSLAPTVSLPKGGGAIRPIGEKLSTNPATGTASFSIPIATPPGRSTFGPRLALTYNSGGGNGPFGLGWSLPLPSITRKTENGLPRYIDAAESDTFILAGSEDLVPVLVQQPSGWVPEPLPNRFIGADEYRVTSYRPRIEGLHAQIERWSHVSRVEDVCWRSISKDNVTTWYGRTRDSRIADPRNRARIYSWLICESRDDRGNAIVYEYQHDDAREVDETRAHERHRAGVADSRSANTYIKRIKYANRVSHLEQPVLAPNGWLFEVVFDYGEGHFSAAPADAAENVFVDAGAVASRAWPVRRDPFSTYRPGFEVRTYRLCERIIIFHRFDELAAESGRAAYPTQDVELRYQHDPVVTKLSAIVQSGYVWDATQDRFLQRSMPPVEFTYSERLTDVELANAPVRDLEAGSAENLPTGVDGTWHQWVDLDGEGISGVLHETSQAWYYKPNEGNGVLGTLHTVAEKPSLAVSGGGHQLLDLAGDGQLDLVQFGGSTAGFFERTDEGQWQTFKAFATRPNINWSDPNLRFIDLDGDGHADVLISEHDVFTWHASLAEDGFDVAQRVAHAPDEDTGPRVVFADNTQSILLADMSGDGLLDIVRVRLGEISYWPNLGFAQFGARVGMDNAPVFDAPDQFEPRRLRPIDVDGSGLTDFVYLAAAGARVYYNQAGNRWSDPWALPPLPAVDQLSSLATADLFGRGTTCLVWSSSQPAHAGRAFRYVDPSGGRKPHLLTKVVNNLGVETQLTYSTSTRFYLLDKHAGRPWISRLPFPVHVVERVETFDRIARTYFAARYAYHHGYFDPIEREFRGFGLVEQWDTEQLAVLTASDAFPTPGVNIDVDSHVPPVYTKTWFHTGVHFGREHVSNFFAGVDRRHPSEYYREEGLNGPEAQDLLLDDTLLPPGLTLGEEREACRALKGSMLRQEVFGLDYSARALHPFTVTEQNLRVERLQPRAGERPGVFKTSGLESIVYHYERVTPADPRVSHKITLEVDVFGNVLKEVSIDYGRRQMLTVVAPDGTVHRTPNAALNLLHPIDRAKQANASFTYREQRYTDAQLAADAWRTPLACDGRLYELVGFTATGRGGRCQPSDFVAPDAARPGTWRLIFDSELAFEQNATGGKQRRLVEHVRTLYRRNDLSDLLPLGQVTARALPGETYRLALTPRLVTQTFQRLRPGQPHEVLLPIPADVLSGQGADRGGYLASQTLKGDGRFPASDLDDHWWVPTGRVFLSPGSTDTSAVEQAHAQRHFYQPVRYRDPFGQESIVEFDTYDLLLVETRDPLLNRIRVELSDYRVLQPRVVRDPNGNRSAVAFDARGLVVGAATMGKAPPAAAEGDDLTGFVADLDAGVVRNHLTQPLLDPGAVLQRATTRLIYDVFAYHRTRASAAPQPPVIYTLARKTHVSDLAPGQTTEWQHSFAYSDGTGREIQTKRQAERVAVGGPPRWVGSGWTIFNNKGNVVRQYEPFFAADRAFEFAHIVGVSAVRFHDAMQRVIATVHANHTYDKTVYEPWRQVNYDTNDTCAPEGTETGDPRTDPHVGRYVEDFFLSQPPIWRTWWDERRNGALGTDEQRAAAKAARHANTPTTAHLDVLGRTVLTESHNRFDRNGAPVSEIYQTRIDFDFRGNQREVRDAYVAGGDVRGRIVLQAAYDLLGQRLFHVKMDAGARWSLLDVRGKVIRAWDARGHNFVMAFDVLRRPTHQYVRGTGPESDPRTTTGDILVDRVEYGESQPSDTALNLRTRIYRHADTSGVMTNDAYDFKGNARRISQQLLVDYAGLPDWSQSPARGETFTASKRFDALNRPVQVVAPHLTTAPPQISVVQSRYNEGDLLDGVDVWLGRSAEPTTMLDRTAPADPTAPVGIENITYNARGQRVRVDFLNGASTFYRYDDSTFRVTRLYTRRVAAFTADCETPLPASVPIAAGDEPGSASCGLQHLHYTYDPAGNVALIRDRAHQPIFFRNRRVDANCDYTYDAIYRLIEATGREHLGQIGGPPEPHSFDDTPRARLPWSANDGDAMGTYTERYAYDAAGNLRLMEHRGDDPSNPGWSRAYDYDEAGAVDATKPSNRLTQSTVSAAVPTPDRYRYDAHGNVTRMPHLGGTHPDQNLYWDFQDRLYRVDLGGGGTVFYSYDVAGLRTRRVWEKRPNDREERIYLGGVEVFRRYGAAGALALERETLHVMDEKQRLALVEMRTRGADAAPARLIRYQHASHIQSVSLELDDQADIVSYEEYTPFGSTAYQAVRSQTDTPKRYRFTGRERDDESGFSYHAARYYAPWLGRWVSCDPQLTPEASNLFAYVGNRPTRLLDETGYAGGPPDADDLDMDKIFDNLEGGEIKRKRFRLDVDEQDAVAGGKAGGVSGSPTAPANKNFKDYMTNEVSKKNFVSDAPEPDIKPFQLPDVNAPLDVKKAAGEKILVGGFDKPDELNELASKIEDAQTDKTKKTNPKIRKEIREGGAPKSAASLEAAGADPKTLTLTTPAGVDQFPQGDVVQLTPKDAPIDPKTGVVKKVQQALDAVANSQAVQTVLKSKATKVVVAVAPILVSGVAKAAPVVGTAVGAADVGSEVAEGNARRAVLAGIGMSEVPIVSQVADIGLAVEDASWVAKDIIDPEQKLEMWYYNTFLK